MPFIKRWEKENFFRLFSMISGRQSTDSHRRIRKTFEFFKQILCFFFYLLSFHSNVNIHLSYRAISSTDNIQGKLNNQMKKKTQINHAKFYWIDFIVFPLSHRDNSHQARKTHDNCNQSDIFSSNHFRFKVFFVRR